MEEIFTVERAAALANCSSRTIERALESGALTALPRVGNVRQISLAELDRFILSRQGAPAKPEPVGSEEEKHWAIQIGAMSPVSRCGKCGSDASVNRNFAWRFFYHGAAVCPTCEPMAPAELQAIKSRLVEQGEPAQNCRHYSIVNRAVRVANSLCPIVRNQPISRDFDWLFATSGSEPKIISQRGAEDACPQAAAALHIHRGTTPDVRPPAPAPVVPDPSIAERTKIHASQVKRLASIVWPANAQENAEVQRKAGMLLDFIQELIQKYGA